MQLVSAKIMRWCVKSLTLLSWLTIIMPLFPSRLTRISSRLFLASYSKKHVSPHLFKHFSYSEIHLLAKYYRSLKSSIFYVILSYSCWILPATISGATKTTHRYFLQQPSATRRTRVCTACEWTTAEGLRWWEEASDGSTRSAHWLEKCCGIFLCDLLVRRDRHRHRQRHRHRHRHIISQLYVFTLRRSVRAPDVSSIWSIDVRENLIALGTFMWTSSLIISLCRNIW